LSFIGLGNFYCTKELFDLTGNLSAGLDIHGPSIGGGLDIHGPKIGLPNVDIDINAPKIGGGLDIHGPKIGEELDINLPKIEIPGIDEPLNLRGILSAGVNDPIILNKHTLDIPDVTIGVKVPKGKKGLFGINLPSLNIHGPKIGLPNVDIDINAPKIGVGLYSWT